MRKSDVQFHNEYYRPSYPAVNVKIKSGLDEGLRAFRKVEPTISARFTEQWIRENLTQEQINEWWHSACESCFEQAEELAVRYAVNHLTSIEVPCPSGYATATHRENLKYFFDEIQASYLKAMKRNAPYRVNGDVETIKTLYKNALTYNQFFKVTRKKLKLTVNLTLPIQRMERLQAPDPLRDAKAFKAKQYREKAQA